MFTCPTVVAIAARADDSWLEQVLVLKHLRADAWWTLQQLLDDATRLHISLYKEKDHMLLPNRRIANFIPLPTP